jgi:16S rRNA (guanine527-N7)-methyltransferase
VRKNTDWEGFSRLLMAGGQRMGFRFGEGQVGRFILHGKELFEWNRVFNLTGFSDVELLAERQFLDVIPLAQILPKGWRVMDVGSGGGFPGIPLKVLRPDLAMWLVDGNRKKTSFLKQVVRLLELKDVSVVHGRVEATGKGLSEEIDKWNAVVTKAVGRLDRLVTLCEPLVPTGGWIVAMKGEENKGEEQCIGSGGFLVRQHNYELPFSRLRRQLVVLKKGVGNRVKDKSV